MTAILMKFCSLVLLALTTGVAVADQAVDTATSPAHLTDSEKRSGCQLLFDGKTTDGWRNYKKETVSDGWTVEDGALVRGQKQAGDLITKDKFKWFELSLEYKISEEGNSGVMFHVAESGNTPWQTGPEIQIQDNAKGHDPQKSGWLYQLYQPVAPKWAQDKSVVDKTRPAGQWNQLYLRISPSNCEVCVNGVVYYRFKLGDKNWNEQVAKSKFAKFPMFGKMGEGHLCLQDHGDEVAYRNIKLRSIADDGSVQQPIDGKLNMSTELAFPKLKWEGWEPFNDAGQARPLRLMELTYANDGSGRCLRLRNTVPFGHLRTRLMQSMQR